MLQLHSSQNIFSMIMCKYISWYRISDEILCVIKVWQRPIFWCIQCYLGLDHHCILRTKSTHKGIKHKTVFKNIVNIGCLYLIINIKENACNINGIKIMKPHRNSSQQLAHRRGQERYAYIQHLIPMTYAQYLCNINTCEHKRLGLRAGRMKEVSAGFIGEGGCETPWDLCPRVLRAVW